MKKLFLLATLSMLIGSGVAFADGGKNKQKAGKGKTEKCTKPCPKPCNPCCDKSKCKKS